MADVVYRTRFLGETKSRERLRNWKDCLHDIEITKNVDKGSLEGNGS